LKRIIAISISILVIVLVLTEFLVFSYFPLSNAYAVSRSNPWGVFTAFLVFDGWVNVITVGFACCMTLVSTALLWPWSRFLLPSLLLVLTNAAGMFSSLVWLASPYSASVIEVVGPNQIYIYKHSGEGMSGAAYGALGVAFILSLLALVFQTRSRPWELTGTRLFGWRLGMIGFGLLILLEATIAISAFSPSGSGLVHTVALFTGLLRALGVCRSRFDYTEPTDSPCDW